MKKIAFGVVITAVAATLAGTAFAWNEGSEEQKEALSLTPDPVNGMEIFDACAACHLSDGWGQPDGTIPQLAGQHRSVLIKQLADIRANKRDNPTESMYPVPLPDAIGDAQGLADVAAYLEILPMNPNWGKGSWGPSTTEYEQGKRFYEETCESCHGEDGMGDAERFYPRINGQHNQYVVRHLQEIRDGRRGNANPDMVAEIKDFTDWDFELIANYVSWLQVPENHLAARTKPVDQRYVASGF